MKVTNIQALENIAKEVRRGIIEEVYSANSGHPGGSLSCADILTVLYFNQMNINPKDPVAEGRDRLVLSKGHSSAALYATLAERGFIKEEDLEELNKIEKRDMSSYYITALIITLIICFFISKTIFTILLIICFVLAYIFIIRDYIEILRVWIEVMKWKWKR